MSRTLVCSSGRRRFCAILARWVRERTEPDAEYGTLPYGTVVARSPVPMRGRQNAPLPSVAKTSAKAAGILTTVSMTNNRETYCVCGHLASMHDSFGCLSLVYAFETAQPSDCECTELKAMPDSQGSRSA